MNKPGKINIQDYFYKLPDDKIAKFPLLERDLSKLLIYHHHKIHHDVFFNLSDYISENSILVFNQTKVIQARFLVKKTSGTNIEIFLLQPIWPHEDMDRALHVCGSSIWKCMIGNKKRFKEDDVLCVTENEIKLTVKWSDRMNDEVLFEWESSTVSFSQILKTYGQMPIPPYLNRAPVEEDKKSYQTVYSRVFGSVAAPTAGLHFTNRVFEKLSKKNIHHEFLTLHVSAGTFKPIKHENALEHEMHEERIYFSKNLITTLLKSDEKVIPVGTTSLRSLESLYWFGAGLMNGSLTEFKIPQDFPYQYESIELPDKKYVLNKIIAYMDENNLNTLEGSTSIYIVPGYQFQMVNGIVTNFHQPASTLLLLIAALVGDDWKAIYNTALQNDYRFLSYGDSSVILL